MKILIAPDKFKGSLSALEFCDIVGDTIRLHHPKAEIILLPLADGGDGTIEVVNHYLQGKQIMAEVNDPFFRKIKASYLYSQVSRTAYIEMAEASGLKRLHPDEFDCIHASSFGTGELILDALNQGAQNLIFGIGGSATNDCGIGMASALGYRFLDEHNQAVHPIGKQLSSIVRIDSSKADRRLSDLSIKVACDVTNPLYGSAGAAHVYAAQKGASPEEILQLDSGLTHFSKILNAKYSIDPQKIPGAGAAGGMGIAAQLFLGGALESGIDLILELARIDRYTTDLDWLITGEGKFDNQTLSGKTIHGLLRHIKDTKSKIAVFCGQTTLEKEQTQLLGIDYVDSITNYASNFDDAMVNTLNYLKLMTLNFIPILKT